jgi:glycosyltransferase involved in cell wall biosynthesis
MTRCALVVIAKDEARYLPEWVAYHLAIGIDRIFLYDNDSTDSTPAMVERLAQSFPIERIDWQGAGRESPQRSAYNDSLARLSDFEWVTFIDVDEFFVPWGFDGVKSFLATVPPHVGMVAMNWRNFGSSGRSDPNYDSVLKTFLRCGPETWTYQCRVKSVARVKAIREVFCHDVDLHFGEATASDFQPMEFTRRGIANRIIYNGVQINHYQTKTFDEFNKRMQLGNVNRDPTLADNFRNGDKSRFDALDRNEVVDRRIEKFLPSFEFHFERVKRTLGSLMERPSAPNRPELITRAASALPVG